MSTLTTELDNFVQSQISNGNYKTRAEVERNIVGEIGAKEFLRSIEKSREQYRNGEGVEVTDEWIKNFRKELADELIPNQD